MSLEQIFVTITIIFPVTMVLLNRLRIDVAALGMALALGTAQYIGLNVLGTDSGAAFAGFSQPVIITMLGLFIITLSLEKVGLMRWIARRLMGLGGNSERRFIVLFTFTGALLSLVMNTVAAGALLLPSAIDVSRRVNIRPSRLLLPVAYGTLLGGMATYFGTAANIIASNLLTETNPAQAPLTVMDFALTGGIVCLAGLVYMAIFSPSLMPNHLPLAEQLILRPGGRELEDAYQIDDRLWEVEILPSSDFIGGTLEQSCIGQQLGLTVVAIWHNRQQILAPSPRQILYTGDILMIVGREDRVSKLADHGLKIRRDSGSGRFSRLAAALIEVVPAPHALSHGKTLKELEFRHRYGYSAVALWRDGRSYRTDVAEFQLRFGDSFLMIGQPNRLKSLQRNPDFIVLEPDHSETPLDWPKVFLALGITFTALFLSILGFPIYLAMILGGLAAILTNLVTMEEAYMGIEWRTIFLIAGMYSVSLAMVQTGLAALIGEGLVWAVAGYGPLGLAVGSYILVVLINQILSSQITALVITPITISAAIHLGVNPQAIALATAIGCSASFLTPLSHPVNMLVLGPGNYQFFDYTRLGLGLTVVCGAALIISLYLFWGL